MAYWQVSHHDRKTYEKLSGAARLLYYDAGAWAMQQVHDKRVALPADWFVPAAVVREWGKKNAATTLVRAGLWAHAKRDGKAGFVYVDTGMLDHNTPRHLQNLRDDDRDAKRRRRSSVRMDNGQMVVPDWDNRCPETGQTDHT